MKDSSLICPHCGGRAKIVSTVFRPFGLQSIHDKGKKTATREYKGFCPACGFTGAGTFSKELSKKWFIEGHSRNPDIEIWKAKIKALDHCS